MGKVFTVALIGIFPIENLYFGRRARLRGSEYSKPKRNPILMHDYSGVGSVHSSPLVNTRSIETCVVPLNVPLYLKVKLETIQILVPGSITYLCHLKTYLPN